jgi:hypothetical protein
MSLLPAASQTHFDLVPVTCDARAVQMPIAIAHHHAVSFDDQHATGRVMRCVRCFVRCLDPVHGCALLAFQFRADAFGLRPQRLTANCHASQLGQQAGRFTKRCDRAKCGLPACQAGTGLLIRRQAKCLVGWAPPMGTRPTVMPPPLESDRTQPRLHVPPTPRLHRPPLVTARTARRDRPRAVFQPCGRHLEHTFQEHRRHHPPGAQHTLFVLRQAAISMCSHMHHQRSAKL